MGTGNPAQWGRFDLPPADPIRFDRVRVGARRVDWGIVFAALLVMAVSGGVLWELGVNYDGMTGSVASKFHPSTYVAVFLIGLAAVRGGDPIGWLATVTALRPASVVMVLGGAVLLGHTYATGGSGLAGAVDTFVTPGLLGLLIGGLSAGRRAATLAAMAWAIHAVMLVNVLIGFAEFVLHIRVFPYRLDGQIYDYDTRSTGLQGHPLYSALVTAVYMICLTSGGGALRPFTRMGVLLMQGAGLVVFGGRSALALTVMVGLLAGAVGLHRTMRRGQVRLLHAICVLVGLVVAPVGLLALAAHGTFDAIETRFTSDHESNGARVAMFELFAPFDLEQLLIGPDLRQVEAARRVAGLEIGVENPLLKLTLYNGLLVTALLLAASVLFFREIVRHSRPGLLLPMLGSVVLLNSFESVGSKSTVYGKLLVIFLALFRPSPDGLASRDQATAGDPRR